MNYNNYESILKSTKITPRGVIHVGEFNDDTVIFYKRLNIKKILVIEPNPYIYNNIKQYSEHDKSIMVANCLISDKNDLIDYTISDINNKTNPIQHIKTITRRLDYMLSEIKQNPYDYNILTIDNQTIDLNAILGLELIINNISCIYIQNNIYSIPKDVNYFLQNHSFKDFSSNNNTLIYIPNNLIQCTTLGINGRFANQIFQHMFIHTYAKQHSLKPENHTWIGQTYFNIQDNTPTRNLEEINLSDNNNYSEESLANKDVIGWFQYHTSYYLPYKNYIQSLYSFRQDVFESIKQQYDSYFENKNVIAIHIRLDDYDHDNFYITPVKYYLDWLSINFNKNSNNILYIATDASKEIKNTIYNIFREYKPVFDLSLNLIVTYAPYIVDFYVLTRANTLLISNSTFSFVASMLNNISDSFYRPDLSLNSLVQYNPWNAYPLLSPPDDFTKEQNNYNLNQYKQTNNSTRKLHIGGTTQSDGWEVINTLNIPCANYIGDASILYQFDHCTFSEIYASHVLEHFEQSSIASVLLEWNRVLSLSGILYISVPNFEVISELITKKYNKSPQDQINLMRMIFGGQIDRFDYHKFGFTKIILKSLLQQSGFDDIKIVKNFNIFDDTSSLRYDNTPISLNIIATKTRHLNMSTEETISYLNSYNIATKIANSNNTNINNNNNHNNNNHE